MLNLDVKVKNKIKIKTKKIHTNLDAFEIYSIFKNMANSVILDSAKFDSNLGRYSFIGINSFLKIKAYKGQCWINDKKQSQDIFSCLKEIIEEYSIENDTIFPFIAGGIGYFSYDLCRNIENLPETAEEELIIPETYFNFYDNIIIYDNETKEVMLTALGILKSYEEVFNEIQYEIERSSKLIYTEKSIKIKDIFHSNFTKKQYMDTVEKVRDYIRNGDIYITNLTQRFWCHSNAEPYKVYKTLRNINPAPFAAYINLEGFVILSSSPERFLKITNNHVETRPIKGTRPRTGNINEDERNKNELINSEKDKPELLMIVDLERNDLSKVCSPNTVKVTELFKLEEYSTVYHLVSTIEGELKQGKDCIDCIKACFPGGSITGAPKIRSMEIIEELEGIRRNVYTGAIGYIGFDKNIDLNIVIRTILMKDDKAYFGVGGGITWESDKEAEYYETLDKAKALMEALSI